MTREHLAARWRDVSTIEKRHTPVEIGEGKERLTVCSRCEGVWKCDAARMVEHVGALVLAEEER